MRCRTWRARRFLTGRTGFFAVDVRNGDDKIILQASLELKSRWVEEGETTASAIRAAGSERSGRTSTVPPAFRNLDLHLAVAPFEQAWRRAVPAACGSHARPTGRAHPPSWTCVTGNSKVKPEAMPAASSLDVKFAHQMREVLLGGAPAEAGDPGALIAPSIVVDIQKRRAMWGLISVTSFDLFMRGRRRPCTAERNHARSITQHHACRSTKSPGTWTAVICRLARAQRLAAGSKARGDEAAFLGPAAFRHNFLAGGEDGGTRGQFADGSDFRIAQTVTTLETTQESDSLNHASKNASFSALRRRKLRIRRGPLGLGGIPILFRQWPASR